MKITTREVGDGICIKEHPITIVPSHFIKFIQYRNPKRTSKFLVYKLDLELKNYILHETVTDKERIEKVEWGLKMLSDDNNEGFNKI